MLSPKQRVKPLHPPTIAEQLGKAGASEDSLWIDSESFIWQVTKKHSGFILSSVNSNAFIPYWTSYKIARPGLRPYTEHHPDDSYPTPCATSPTIAEIMLANDVKDDDRYIDATGIRWSANASHAGEGFELQDCSDNAWLPWKTCELISLPGFKLLATATQLKARSVEFYR